MAKRLSELVQSVDAIGAELRQKVFPRPSGSIARLRERISRYLDDCTFAQGIRLGLLTWLLYAICVVWHTWAAPIHEVAPFDSAMAEFLGALLGILLAIIVFSVQLHAQRADEGAFLVSYLVRKHRIYLITTFTAGVTMANVCAVLSAQSGLPVRLDTVPWWNMAMLPLVVGGSLWLLHATVIDAARLDFDPQLRLFRQDMLQALAESTWQHRMADALAKECQRVGLELTLGWGPALLGNERTDFRIERHGVIGDVNLAVLNRLAEAVARTDARGHLILRVGETVGQRACFVVAPPRSEPLKRLAAREAARSDTNKAGRLDDKWTLMEADRQAIQNLVDNLFLLRATRPTAAASLTEFLQRYATYLRELAQDRRSPRLEATLGRLRAIVEEWAQMAPDASLGSQPEFGGTPEGIFAGPLAIQLPDAILSAIRSGDTQTFDALVSMLEDMNIFAGHKRLLNLLHESGGLIQFSYYQAMEANAFAEFCGRRFDQIAYHLFVAYESRRTRLTSDEPETEVFDRESAALHEAVRTAINLVRIAIRTDRPEDARQFVERVLGTENEHVSSHRIIERAPERESADTLTDYVRMALIGWSLAWMQRHPDRSGAARAVVQAVLHPVVPVVRLLGVWELYRGQSEETSTIDARLGLQSWSPDDPEEWRAGKTYGGFVDDEWIDRGLHAMLLRAEARIEPADYFLAPPRRFLWRADRSKQWLEALSAIEDVGLAAEHRTQTIEHVLKLIRAREALAERRYVERAITQPIDDAIWKKFVAASNEQIERDRAWICALREIGAGGAQASSVPARRSEQALLVQRDFFVPGNNWHDGFSPWLAEALADREAANLFGVIEKSCATHGSVKSLTTLGGAVRAAAEELRLNGFNPNLIALPRSYRFGCALFDQPLWNVEDRNRFGKAGIGRWEGMAVLSWPYGDAHSALVADAGRLFGAHGLSNDIDLVVEDLDDEQRNDLLSKLDVIVGAGEVPTTDSTRVRVVGRVIPALGLSDFSAGLLVDLGQSDGAYAISEVDNLYHRVTCPEIEGDDSARIRLVPRLEGEENREPCQKCHPERMDVEAQMGKR